MKWKIFLIIFLSVTSLLSAKTLRLKSSVIVNSSSVFLSDIVDNHSLSENEKSNLNHIKIAEFDSNQKFINIKSETIRETLKMLKINDIQLTGQIVSVYFKQKSVSDDELKNLINQFLSKKLHDYNDITIDYVKLPLIYIQNEEYLLSVNEIDLNNNSSSIILSLNCKTHDSKTEIYTAHVKLFKTYEVFQLKNSKKMSEEFYISDLQKTIVRDLRSSKYDLTIDDILNSVAYNYCPKGKIINTSDLRDQPLVRKDQLVKVNVRSDSFQLSYEALAKSNAWMGEQITLQNPENKKFFNARVIAKNTVEINLEEK